MIQKTSEIKIEMTENEINIADVPDEYIDPITGDIMQDPVQLPSSKQILDRGSIKQVLLNDEHDPFNRAPLKYSEIVDLPDFKIKIQDWVASKKAEMKKKALDADRKMDIIDEKKPTQHEMEEEKDDDAENTKAYDPFNWNNLQ